MTLRCLLRPAAAFGLLATLGGCYGTNQAPYAAANAPPGTVLSQHCVAGVYQCTIPPGPLGAPCSCPGLGAPSYGIIR